MLPTSPKVFEEEVVLLLQVVATTVMDSRHRQGELTQEQYDWFANHCDLRIRYLDANNPRWHKDLRAKGNKGRDLCYTFVNHWLDSFESDPEGYKAHHPDFAFGEYRPIP